MRMSKEGARKYLLFHHNLTGKKMEKGKIADYIRKIGCIQYDPLDIVGKNHHLVLQSRISGYKPEFLYDLLYKERVLVEGWDKMMSIYSIQDWAYFKRFREDKKRYPGKSKEEVYKFLPLVREHISKNGPTSSINIDVNQKVDWSWKSTNISKAVMESMFFWGELVIYKRINTRRIYDFANNYLNKEILEKDDPNVTMEQYWDWHLLRRMSGIGMLNLKSQESWLGILQANKDTKINTINRLIESERVITVEIDDLKGKIFYINKKDYEEYKKIENSMPAERTSIIAPLDNLIWDRRLINDIFDFEYSWEVYLPVEKRKYGYYVLPILHGNDFMGRFEPHFDKKKRIFTINNFWAEREKAPDDYEEKALIDCFAEFAKYLNADRVELNAAKIDKKKYLWIEEVNKKIISDI